MSWTIKKKQRLAEGRASQTGGPPQPMGGKEIICSITGSFPTPVY